jgi:ABC-type phosphate transport system permease subunit
MSKCPGCGVELLDGTTFCPYCGSKVVNQNEEQQNFNQEVNENVILENTSETVNAVPQEKKVFKVFAVIGHALAIVTLVAIGLSLLLLGIPQLGYMIAAVGAEASVPALVFGIIGKKSRSERGKAKFAFIVGLIGTIVLTILVIVYAVLLALSEVNSGGGGYTYY